MNNNNASLKDVIFNGGKVNDPNLAKNKAEKILENRTVRSEKVDVVREIDYRIWFDLFTVKFTAYFLLPCLTVIILHFLEFLDIKFYNIISQIDFPYYGKFVVKPATFNWILTTISGLGFALACYNISREGRLAVQYPHESEKLYNGLYESEFIKRLVKVYIILAESLFVLGALFGSMGALMGTAVLFFGYIFDPDKYGKFPVDPVYLFVYLASGVIFHYLFMPPQRPNRRKFGLTKDFSEFIQKESFIPYRYYGERPTDLIPSLTYYVFHAIKIVATLILNVLLWSFNKFKVKKALIVFKPLVWLIDLLEIVVLDLTFYTLGLINYCLGWGFKILAFAVFALGLLINTKRMMVLKADFNFETLLVNIGIIALTLIVFIHFYHCVKFFKAVDAQGARKSLKDFFNW